MGKSYRRITFLERQKIEEGLDRGASFTELARSLGRAVSTISREVKSHRVLTGMRSKLAKCRYAAGCTRTGACRECPHEGRPCAGCSERDCRTECPAYAAQSDCAVPARAPWVCNACPKLRYGCNRRCRAEYRAAEADAASRRERSESRRGIDMEPAEAERVIAVIRDAQKRGLSPYEVSVAHAGEVPVSPSTIYRWTEAGYGGLAAIDLERKVGFKKRKTAAPRRTTAHSRARSHDAWLALPEAERAATLEMDCVEGRRSDAQAVLTLYDRATHLQLALLLAEKDCAHVAAALESVRSVCDPELADGLFATVLTDNGGEFADEAALGAALGERGGRARPRLFYCDPAQSQQKAGCEKNHSELRQILEKGLFSFDELEGADLAVVMSHANSNPRLELRGLSPIAMFRAAYGGAADELLDALGIEEVPGGELTLRPWILDIERDRRGAPPLTRLK